MLGCPRVQLAPRAWLILLAALLNAWTALAKFGGAEGKTVRLHISNSNAIERSAFSVKHQAVAAALPKEKSLLNSQLAAKNVVYSFWATPGSDMAELQSTLQKKPSAFVANASHACYAERHSYDFQFELIPNTPLADASVARTVSLLRIFGDGTKGSKPQLEEGSWLMYTDADTYVIDPDRSIESMVDAAHKMQTTRMAAAKLAGGEGGCDLIIQEDGATGDPGANAGWFLLRNSEWSRTLLQRWADTRTARKGDYVQIRQCCGGDDQPALMDLIIHEAGGSGMPVKYDDRCFNEHLQQLPAWKKDKEWMDMTEPYNKYCLCWSREMDKLKVGYKRGEGVFLPKVCVLPYPNNVVKGDRQAQLLSVQARDGVNELEAQAKHRFLMHDKYHQLKIRVSRLQV
jgi:hypothetical protein